MRYITLIIITIFALYSCNDNQVFTDSNARLTFSTDTVMFDTVFTGIGSATQTFKVYNPYNQPIRISSIELAGGSNSPYNLNIDGTPLHKVSNVEIMAEDSIFIFVEVNINPSANDIVEKDSILFCTNGNLQNIKTVAFGQNINLIRGEHIQTTTWTNEKPYLIYNSSLVDTLETLTIEAGSTIYLHQGASLFVLGTLHVYGSKEAPITFRGDRLENFYEDKPGQWGAFTTLDNGAIYVFGGIHFLAGSFDNIIDHAIIKNANKGIQLDSAVGQTPTLQISNTVISHMNLAGIYAQTSRIKGKNLVINNCNSHAIALTLGGSYNFNHITVANYTPYSSRNTASIALNNYYTYNSTAYIYNLEEATFTNSIIYGDGGENGNEIVIDYAGEGTFEYLFDHCMVRVSDEFDTSDPNRYKNIIQNPSEGPCFVSKSEYCFELDSLSPAINNGLRAYGELIPLDLNNNNRLADEAPDLGAYEKQ